VGIQKAWRLQMTNKKKSFILYMDTYENIKDIPLEEKGKLLDAIFNHALDNTVELTGVAGMAFNFIKMQMDRDSGKYETFIEKQRLNGKKGGRPKANPSLKEDIPKNPSLNLNTQKSLTDTVNDTVTVNVTDSKDKLPDFIDLVLWDAFVQMRKENKSKMTDKAKQLAVTKLTGFHAEGYDVNKIIEEAIMNGWKSFYKPKGDNDAEARRNNKPRYEKKSVTEQLRDSRARLDEDLASGAFKV
jgi:hypothetical protein